MDELLNYTELIEGLWNWARNVHGSLANGIMPTYNCNVMQTIKEQIRLLSEKAIIEYPFYSKELLKILPVLFGEHINGVHTIRTVAFGEFLLIIKHLKNEPLNTSIWNEMHPRIRSISFDLYADGHFDAAAEKAIKEVEQRLREIFHEARPISKEPRDASDIVGALFSDHGAFRATNDSTPSGKSYCRGIRPLFEGFLASYRNPSCHGNRKISKHEAIEQIAFSSQLMFILDNGSIEASTKS